MLPKGYRTSKNFDTTFLINLSNFPFFFMTNEVQRDLPRQAYKYALYVHHSLQSDIGKHSRVRIHPFLPHIDWSVFSANQKNENFNGQWRRSTSLAAKQEKFNKIDRRGTSLAARITPFRCPCMLIQMLRYQIEISVGDGSKKTFIWIDFQWKMSLLTGWDRTSFREPPSFCAAPETVL